MGWLRRWGPALVWAGLISFFSTGLFTSDNTSRFIVPILRWFLPHATTATLFEIHHLIRKGAHLAEYFILSLLILRSIRDRRREMHLRWALLTVLLVAAYASLDEFHQVFVPGRTPAVKDVMLDTAGGIAAQIVAALLAWQGRTPEQEAVGTSR